MSKTIMIVEDHPAVRTSLVAWLQTEFSHVEIVSVSSGEEAVAAYDTDQPQLVVMDLKLPGINGIEATRQIKAIAPDAKIVMLTIHDQDAYRADAAAAGVSAYIAKRVMKNELIPTLQALLMNYGSRIVNHNLKHAS
jgi:DNA-binding NarL/FixJ family response regulator